MVEAGRVYCQTSKSFVTGLQELGHHCSGDAVMEVGGLHAPSGFTLFNEVGVRSSSVLQGCLEKFSTKLSVILKAQGVSGLDLLTFICPSSRLTLIDSSAAFSFCVCACVPQRS